MAITDDIRAATASKLKQTVDAVAQELVEVEYHSGAAFVRTPLMYPSGANVVVRVNETLHDHYHVTDIGLGYQEAELMGTSLVYSRHARSIAENAGIGFDSEAFFVLSQVTREQLAGAVATVANCSQEAVALAAYKMAERRASDLGEQLHERLVRLFTPSKVAKNAQIYGASNTEYHVSSLVRVDKRPAIFEPVANHPTSIAFASSKFHDLALLEQPPIQVAVVRKKKDLGTYHNLLAQVAHVIETDVSDERIVTLAKAA